MSHNMLFLKLMYKNRYFRTLFRYRTKLISRYLWGGAEKTFIIGVKHIGPGFYVAHPYATTLFAKSIGKNFTCHQCTTLGIKQEGRGNEKPTIGDNVKLGAHVCIIGDVKIGNNVVVAAGSIVVKDVPDNCVVAGNPAKVIRTIVSST